MNKLFQPERFAMARSLEEQVQKVKSLYKRNKIMLQLAKDGLSLRQISSSLEGMGYVGKNQSPLSYETIRYNLKLMGFVYPKRGGVSNE